MDIYLTVGFSGTANSRKFVMHDLLAIVSVGTS